MDPGLLLQYVVVALAVAASVAFIVRRQFPAAVRRLRIALAVPLVREGRPAWMRRLGRVLVPPSRDVDGSGCGGCDGCD